MIIQRCIIGIANCNYTWFRSLYWHLLDSPVRSALYEIRNIPFANAIKSFFCLCVALTQIMNGFLVNIFPREYAFIFHIPPHYTRSICICICGIIGPHPPCSLAWKRITRGVKIELYQHVLLFGAWEKKHWKPIQLLMQGDSIHIYYIYGGSWRSIIEHCTPIYNAPQLCFVLCACRVCCSCCSCYVLLSARVGKSIRLWQFNKSTPGVYW